MNGFNWKKYGMIASCLAATLGIMVSWQSLEFLPRWAWYSEVAAVESFAEDTRILVLGQEWERLDQQIEELTQKVNLMAAERELLSKLRHRKAVVEQQLKKLLEGK